MHIQGIAAEQRPSSAPVAGAGADVILPFTNANPNLSSSSLPTLALSARPSSQKSWFGSLTRPKGSKSSSPSKMNVVQSFQEPQLHEDTISSSILNATESIDSPAPPAAITRGNGVDATLEQPFYTPSTSPRSVAPLAQPISDPRSPSLHAPTLLSSHSQANAAPTSSPTSLLPPVSITPAESTPVSPPVVQDSLPSSIDEESPVVDQSAVVPPHQISASTNSAAKIGNLNAPSSRFALSIPFLGRAKVPLDSVLKTEEKGREMVGLPGTQSAEVNAGGFF